MLSQTENTEICTGARTDSKGIYMKILITTDLYATKTNGVVTSVKNLWDELSHKGHDVRILTLSDRPRSRKEGSVYYIRSMPLGVYPGVRMPLSYHHALIRELVEWQPDIIHSQCEFFSYQFALYISKHTGAPIVHTYHTMYEQYAGYIVPSERLGKRLAELLTQKRLKRVELILAPTDKIKQLLDSYELDKKICVVPSGIDLEQHKKQLPPDERSERRQALGIADDQHVLINLGRLGTEKNPEELLRFFSSALAQDSSMTFLFVGDGPAKSQLESTANDLGIADRVIFTGMVDPSEVQDYYQLGDIFVSASTSETQGLTYIEAAANGLPLLCRKDPCLDGVITPGENGYAYTNEHEFLDAVQAIIHDPDWCEAAGQHSREKAAAFDKKTFGTAVEEIYHSVLD